MLLWVWLQFDHELVCDDPRNTMLMMPPSLSYYSLHQRRDGKHCGNDLFGNRNDELRVSPVWEKGRLELVVWLVK